MRNPRLVPLTVLAATLVVLLAVTGGRASAAVQSVTLIGSSGTDVGQGVATAPDGTVYVAGSTTSARIGGQRNAGQTDILLVKRGDGVGLPGWIRLLGGTDDEVGYGVAVARDGSIYVTGWTESAELGGQRNAGGADIVLAKYSPAGRRLWTRLLGSVDREEGRGVALAGDGSVYITGFTTRGDSDRLADQTKPGDLDVVLAGYDPKGKRLWVRLLGGSSQDVGYGVTVSRKGSIYLTGSSRGWEGQPSVGHGDDVFLARYTPSGSRLWARLLGGSLIDEGHGVAVSSDESVYVAGLWGGALDMFNGDIVIARYDSSGSREWRRLLAGARADIGEGVAVGRNGSIYIVGWTWSPALAGKTNNGGTDIVAARYSPAGALLSADLLGGASVELGHGVAPGIGAVQLVGETASSDLGGQANHGQTDVVLAQFR